MENFVLRTSDWILWNAAPWSGEWVQLVITPLKGCSNRYYVAWNGQRLSSTNDMVRARKRFGPEVERLEADLRLRLRRQGVAA